MHSYWISFVTVHSRIVFCAKCKPNAALVKFGRPQMANLFVLFSFIWTIHFCSWSLCVLNVCWQAEIHEIKQEIQWISWAKKGLNLSSAFIAMFLNCQKSYFRDLRTQDSHIPFKLWKAVSSLHTVSTPC